MSRFRAHVEIKGMKLITLKYFAQFWIFLICTFWKHLQLFICYIFEKEIMLSPFSFKKREKFSSCCSQSTFTLHLMKIKNSIYACAFDVISFVRYHRMFAVRNMFVRHEIDTFLSSFLRKSPISGRPNGNFLVFRPNTIDFFLNFVPENVQKLM